MNSMTVLDYCEKYLYKMIAKKTGARRQKVFHIGAANLSKLGGGAIWILLEMKIFCDVSNILNLINYLGIIIQLNKTNLSLPPSFYVLGLRNTRAHM